MLRLYFKVENLKTKLHKMSHKCKIQRKFLIVLLFINFIITPICFGIQGIKYYKLNKELSQANQTLDILQHLNDPERGVELLKPTSDYSIEDQKEYKLPPLPKSIKI